VKKKECFQFFLSSGSCLCHGEIGPLSTHSSNRLPADCGCKYSYFRQKIIASTCMSESTQQKTDVYGELYQLSVELLNM
jgi:hypothetical protein